MGMNDGFLANVMKSLLWESNVGEYFLDEVCHLKTSHREKKNLLEDRFDKSRPH